jgi:hypothetical protein
MEQATEVRRWNPIRALVKGILFLIVKPTVLAVLAFRRFPALSFIVLLAVIGGIIAFSSGTSLLPGLAFGSVGSGSGAAATGRPIAVETYLTGQKEFQARLMWEALSDDLKRTMSQNGRTMEATQQQLEQSKRSGIKYTGLQYVAGVPLNDGRSVHLYIVSVSVPSNQGQRDEQVPYTFTVDKTGKIVNID